MQKKKNAEEACALLLKKIEENCDLKKMTDAEKEKFTEFYLNRGNNISLAPKRGFGKFWNHIRWLFNF
jgi:hypothetical protein